MAKTYRLTQSNVSVVTGPKVYNYVELESTIEQSGNNIVGSYWFHWHEPNGWNLRGVAYMWYIRFLDASGNILKDVDVTVTNVSNYAARLFYWPASTSQPTPVTPQNLQTETVLDRFANDSSPTRRDLYSNDYYRNATKCQNGELLRRRDGTYSDNTRMNFTIPLSEVPNNARAYCNYVVFAQYSGSGGTPQDPTDPVNQFGHYSFPSESIAIDDDDLIIDFASKIYYKNGSWSDRGRVYHKESGSWQKRYLYKKKNGSWVKVP